MRKKYAVVVQGNIPRDNNFVESMLSHFVAENYDGIILVRAGRGHEFAHERIGLSKTMLVSRLERLAKEVNGEDILFIATVASIEQRENDFALKVQDSNVTGTELEKSLREISANTIAYLTGTLHAAEGAQTLSWIQHEELGYRIVGISSLPKRVTILPEPYHPPNLKPPYIQRRQSRHFPTIFDYTFFSGSGQRTIEERFKDARDYQRLIYPSLCARIFTKNPALLSLYV